MTVAGGRWPFPGDAPVVIARRVAQAYRSIALAAHPAACGKLDAKMADWGVRWIVPRVVTADPDDWLPSAQVADLAAVDPASVRQWRRRGRLTGRKVGGRWEHRVRDVLALAAEDRRRKPASS